MMSITKEGKQFNTYIEGEDIGRAEIHDQCALYKLLRVCAGVLRGTLKVTITH